MNKQLARDILNVFDTKMTVDTISAYADYEIDKANKGLWNSTDPVEIHRLQGVVRAMLVLKAIRSVAESVAKSKDN